MRIADLADYFRLRRHFSEPWAFLQMRRARHDSRYLDAPLRDGGRIRFRAGGQDRHVIHRIFARDEYRLEALPAGSLGTVIDIGAHVGSFAIRVAPLAERVLSFEPMHDSFTLLEANLAGRPNVEGFHMGVAGRSGKAIFYPGPTPAADSIYVPEAERSGAGVEVATTSLAEIFEVHRIERCDFLKVDCEGAEYDILYSMPPKLWQRIDRIGLEYHEVEGAPGNWSGTELARHIEQAGHRVELVRSKRRPLQGLIFSSRV